MNEPWHDDASRFDREQFRAQLTERQREAMTRLEESGRALAEAAKVFGEDARRVGDAIRAAFANLPPETLAEIWSAGRWPSSTRLAYRRPEGT